MKRRVVLAALILFPVIFTNSFAATKSAEEVVREAVVKTTAKLVEEKEQLKAHPERIYDLIQDLVVPHFDFPIISRLVLGKTIWNQASETQKEQFIHEFTTLLVKTYAKALQEYSDEDVVFLPDESSPDSRLIEIKTEVTGRDSAARTPINYRMHMDGSEWKVLDLVVDGISLVNSYKGEYSSIVRKDGLDGLIARMKEKNTGTTVE